MAEAVVLIIVGLVAGVLVMLVLGGVAVLIFFFCCRKSGEKPEDKEKDKQQSGNAAKKQSKLDPDDNNLQANTRSMIEAREMYGDKQDLALTAMPSADIFKTHFKDQGIIKAEETLKELDKRPPEKPGLGDRNVIDSLKHKAGAVDEEGPSALIAEKKAYKQQKAKGRPGKR